MRLIQNDSVTAGRSFVAAKAMPTSTLTHPLTSSSSCSAPAHALQDVDCAAPDRKGRLRAAASLPVRLCSSFKLSHFFAKVEQVLLAKIGPSHRYIVCSPSTDCAWPCCGTRVPAATVDSAYVDVSAQRGPGRSRGRVHCAAGVRVRQRRSFTMFNRAL